MTSKNNEKRLTNRSAWRASSRQGEMPSWMSRDAPKFVSCVEHLFCTT